MINQKSTYKKFRRHKKRRLRLKKKFRRLLWIVCTSLLFILLLNIVIFLPYPSEAQHLQKSNNKATISYNNTDVSLNDNENIHEPTIDAALNDNETPPYDLESSTKGDLFQENKPSQNTIPSQENSTVVEETCPSTIPPSSAVNADYFNDAVFIGDSRTEGFCMYTDIANAKIYAHKGLTVDTVFTEPVININGSNMPIVEALRQTSFQKVYIMLGLNEIGWAYSSIFVEKYENLVDEIKNINPNATIYLQSILPVSNEVSSTHDYIKNERINEYNRFIAQIANEKNVCYLNVAESVVSSSGALPDDAAVDGIHLKKEYCQKWFEYLKNHAI